MAEARSAKGKVSQLIEAVTADESKKVDAMLAAGADPAAADNRGRTPLQYAERRGPSKAREAIVGMLGGTKGSEVCEKTPSTPVGETPAIGQRILSRLSYHFGTWESSRWTRWGFSCLGVVFVSVIAILSRDRLAGVLILPIGILVATAAFMLEQSAQNLGYKHSVLYPDVDGETDEDPEPDPTPLMTALVRRTGPQKLRSMIAHGADVNERNRYGQTVLESAAFDNKNPAVFRVFLEAGARVDEADNDGNRALANAAAWNDNPEVIKVLLEAGADVNAEDKRGYTALTYAQVRSKSRERRKIIKLLKAAGAVEHKKI